MTHIDFRELKRNVSIHQTMQHLHLEMHQIAPGWYRGWCPHCEAHTLMVLPAYGYFFCAGGRISGDQLSLYSHVKNISVREAARRLTAYYGGTMKAAPPRRSEPVRYGQTQTQRGG